MNATDGQPKNITLMLILSSREGTIRLLGNQNITITSVITDVFLNLGSWFPLGFLHHLFQKIIFGAISNWQRLFY